MKEYLERLEAARTRFEWATEQKDIDAAIYELKSAELSLSNKVIEEKERDCARCT